MRKVDIYYATVGKKASVKNDFFTTYYWVVISALFSKSVVYIKILNKQKGQVLKKKTRIIWALLGGALAISGAIIAYAGVSPSEKAPRYTLTVFT